MGASLNTRDYPDAPRSEIEREWKKEVAIALSNYGDRNTGSIAELRGRPIRWHDKMLASEDDASSHISDTHEKWESPVAVSYSKSGSKHWLIGGWCRE